MATNYFSNASAGDIAILNVSGNILLGTGTSAPYSLGVLNTGNVYVRNSLGIQTVSPGIALDVNGKWGTTVNTSAAAPSVGVSGGTGDRMILYPGNGALYPYSLGISIATLWYSTPSGSVHNWYIGGTSIGNWSSTGLSVVGSMTVSNTIYVTGGDNVFTGTPYAYYSYPAGAGTYSGANTAVQTSISTTYRIRAPEYDAFSDRRIKKDIQDRDGHSDLETLMKIRMRSFKHIDHKKSGDDENIGVIAQELESIAELRSCVKNFTDYIPDTFEKRACVCSDKDIHITGDAVGDDGDEIRFYYVDGKKEVLKTGTLYNQGKTIRVDESLTIDGVFVYGKKVDDFKSVVYNSIHNLNISATQCLAKKLEAALDRIETLERLCETLMSRL